MKKIFFFSILVFIMGCKVDNNQKELSTQEKIALIDSIISQNDMSITIESINLCKSYKSGNLILSADQLITDNDSLKFFFLRHFDDGEVDATAIILPSEIKRLCAKIDSVVNIVSKPIAYNKVFTISNNGGLSITARTNEDKKWNIFLNLKDEFKCQINKEYIQFIAEILKKCVDENGEMKSSKMLANTELSYHPNDKEFFKKIDKIEGIKRTDSGVRYEIILDKQGEKPTIEDRVKFRYKGFLPDNTKFDEQELNAPINAFIKGFQDGLLLMSVGAKYKLYIPSFLAYQDDAGSNDIPPYSPLIFEVELLGIN